MKRVSMTVISLLVVLSLACSFSGQSSGGAKTPLSPRSGNPPSRPQGGGDGEAHCGDHICDDSEDVQTCPEDCQMPSERRAASDSGYRKVTIAGTINIRPNPEAVTDFTGTATTYDGEYTFELWFPPEGGEIVQQHNTVTLTDVGYEYFGDVGCTPCTATLDESTAGPVEFPVDATLTLNAATKNGQPADVLTLKVAAPPAHEVTYSALCSCAGARPGDVTDPAAYPVLSYYWYFETQTWTVQLDTPQAQSVENHVLAPAEVSLVTIPQERLTYTTVSSLER